MTTNGDLYPNDPLEVLRDTFHELGDKYFGTTVPMVLVFADTSDRRHEIFPGLSPLSE